LTNEPFGLSNSFTNGQKYWLLVDETLEVSKKNYLKNVKTIQEEIVKGTIYQVNYTDRLPLSFEGSVTSLYTQLKMKQDVSYAAMMRYEDKHIVSLSPELFFRSNANGKITVRPMKGTAPLSEKDFLQHDTKNLSENIMIVDLLRNDLGRICKKGTIHVQDLCHVERYPSVLQMTSSIAGFLKKNTNLYDIFKALFPCGSVTGVPKIKTMRLINELEEKARGVYTGAIGYFAPDGSMAFNVPIRTLEFQKNKVSMGVGSGIVADSIAEDEYSECLLKTEFLRQVSEPMMLLETLRWENAYSLLKKHKERLKESSEVLGISFNENCWQKILDKLAGDFQKDQVYKVHFRLMQNGEMKAKSKPVRVADDWVPKLTLSSFSVDSSNPWLKHKSSHRALYNSEHSRVKMEGYWDCLFCNERGELTEGAICNVYLKKGAIYYTPPLLSGVLGGVYRKHLLETRSDIQEKILYKKDLLEAEAVYVSNAVVGLYLVDLVVPDLAQNHNKYFTNSF
jgi:para-aminobenzoate synthetase/4-amino-4-deoxychorismate lyase